MKQMLFVFNPRSGKAQIKNHLLNILDIFIKGGYEIQVHVTQRTKDAMNMVLERAAGKDLVVCSGGDGTLNETISGLMQLENPPLLGYIPAGSTNDFAASLGLPFNMNKAAREIMDGAPYPIDIGHFCEDRYFVYIAAFGAFTEVSYMTPQEKKNVLGHQAYMLEGVKSLLSVKPYHMKVETEDQIIEDDFIFGMVTNTISVGGFKGLVPQSVALNDGMFEVLLIRMPKTPLDLSNIISYMFLKEEQNEYVHKFKAKYLTLSSEEPVDWVLDGEFGGTRTEVTIENLQKRINILKI
ncbi:MAG: YegS/Rv2252/BmrU family lipid kinase [Clostridiaceae bacterium]|nr:YegS/Rv2252/BmrU family lipid kinase [Clostridiaceae bacterium]